MVILIKYKCIFIVLLFIVYSTSSCSFSGKPDIKNSTDNQQDPAPTGHSLSPDSTQTIPSPELREKADIILGSYETDLSDSDPDRINNINLAINEVCGHIMQPGETFSFNGIVGERTSNRGYKKAKIMVDGEVINGTGGGICQLSSTLYNAAEQAALEVVERHPHGKRVSYVPEGQDATVSYGTLDLKFKNTKNYPIQIRARIENNKVYVSILKNADVNS